MDGGAMFGVTPKMLWIKHKIPDARNRVPVAANCLLVQGPQGSSLVEGGVGDKYSEKEMDHFGLDDLGRLTRGLRQAGIEPEEIDHVFLTHLHFDHCGALTRHDGVSLKPTFPRARVFVQRREYEALQNPDPRSRQTYRSDNIQAIADAGLLELVDGDGQLVPGFELRVTPGHTAGHQVVLVHAGDDTVAFMGDLVPYPSHFRTNWIAGTDLEPVVSMQTKTRFLEEAREKGYIVVLYHEHLAPVGRLSGDDWESF
jgi:glyoxylase-like metal-dependent hydrolase (beta-lactamase superfamily II)